MATLQIRTPTQTYTVIEGKPVLVQWKAKNKQRPGIGYGVGWIKRGEKPHSFLLIHSTFQTYDEIEREYPAKWTIWDSQVLCIKPLASVFR
ncbi:MAG: hypothetical protein MJ016_02260 [Victivallaceae bacterium]|nr:hypothetical protein [Victivallaceae bacterium]